MENRTHRKPGWWEVDGPKIRGLREDLGLSQRALAEKAGTTQATISRLEGEERQAQKRTVRNLAEVLGVDPRSLVRIE